MQKKSGSAILFSFFYVVLVSSIGTSHEESKIHEILITDEGFSPKEIAIEQGEAIVFKNAGKNMHWPASDIHPSHGLYPDSNIINCGKKEMFDACHGLEQGESWSFTFVHFGKWSCHDHLYPTLRCTILVKGSNDATSPNDQDISSNSDGQQLNTNDLESKKIQVGVLKKLKIRMASALYAALPSTLTAWILDPMGIAKNEDELRYLLSMNEPKTITQSLLDQSGSGNWQDCHQQAHQVGRIGYDLYGVSLFSDFDASCHSGVIHGAMERFLAQQGTGNISAKAEELCSKIDTDFGEYQCLHGIGHGVLAYLDYDLPAATNLCEGLNSTFAVNSCYSGAFMENIIAAQGQGARSSHETQWVSDDAQFPCNVMNKTRDMQEKCYQMQTSWMLRIFKNDHAKVIEACMNAPEAMREPCFLSFGRDAAGNSLRDTKIMKELCSSVPELYKMNCVMGAVNVVIDFWGTDLHDQASEFCLGLEGKERKTCFEIITIRLGEIFKEKEDRDRICGTFGEFSHLCNGLVYE